MKIVLSRFHTGSHLYGVYTVQSVRIELIWASLTD